MEEKNIKLKVRQNDLLEAKDQIIYYGAATIEESMDSYYFAYRENTKTKVKLKINQKEGYLKREGDVLTQINFKLHAYDQCKVATDVGNIFMDVKTLEIRLEDDNIFLYYELLEAGAIVGRFKLRLEWEYE